MPCILTTTIHSFIPPAHTPRVLLKEQLLLLLINPAHTSNSTVQLQKPPPNQPPPQVTKHPAHPLLHFKADPNTIPQLLIKGNHQLYMMHMSEARQATCTGMPTSCLYRTSPPPIPQRLAPVSDIYQPTDKHILTYSTYVKYLNASSSLSKCQKEKSQNLGTPLFRSC